MSAPRSPYIDPNVQYILVSKLRQLNAAKLRALDKTLVVQDAVGPLAVILTYETFLKMQKMLQGVEEDPVTD